jgi:hypothetical protein
LPADPKEQSDSIAAALTEVTERVTALVHDEIELAKAEVTEKVIGIGKGAAAIAAGAVFGVFAVVFFLLTLAWVLDGIFVVILLVLTVGAGLFAWRKLKAGAPMPTMAIDEAKKIRATVTTSKPELKA